MVICAFPDIAWFWAFGRGREHARRLNLNSEHAFMQIDVSVGRAVFIGILHFCMEHGFLSEHLRIFRDFAWFLGIFERSGACATVQFEFRARIYAD